VESAGLGGGVRGPSTPACFPRPALTAVALGHVSSSRARPHDPMRASKSSMRKASTAGKPLRVDVHHRTDAHSPVPLHGARGHLCRHASRSWARPLAWADATATARTLPPYARTREPMTEVAKNSVVQIRRDAGARVVICTDEILGAHRADASVDEPTDRDLRLPRWRQKLRSVANGPLILIHHV
jgi:hypothetical protein